MEICAYAHARAQTKILRVRAQKLRARMLRALGLWVVEYLLFVVIKKSFILQHGYIQSIKVYYKL